MDGSLNASIECRKILLLATEFDRKLRFPNNIYFACKGNDGFSTSEIHKVQPDVVISPLFTLKYDAIDVGKLIMKHVPNALLLLQGPTLPRPGMILKEIIGECPELNVDIFDNVRWNNQSLLIA